MDTKTCSGCGEPKPVSEFWKCSATKDGLQSYCKACAKRADDARRATPKGKASKRAAWLRWFAKPGKREIAYAANRRYDQTEKGIATRKRASAKFWKSQKAKALRKKHKAKIAGTDRQYAREAVAKAIQRGKLPRARTLTCKHCGQPADAYHHHNGYALEHYFDVIPLCRLCHEKAHGRGNHSTVPL